MNTTLNVKLVPQDLSHAQGLFQALSDPKIYEFLDEELPENVDVVRRRIVQLQRGVSKDGTEIWLNWSVFDGGRIVGFTQATVYRDGLAEIAYVLTPSTWGTGVAARACKMMLTMLVKDHGVTRFAADTELGNKRSQKLLDLLGFIETKRDADEVFYARRA